MAGSDDFQLIISIKMIPLIVLFVWLEVATAQWRVPTQSPQFPTPPTGRNLETYTFADIIIIVPRNLSKIGENILNDAVQRSLSNSTGINLDDIRVTNNTYVGLSPAGTGLQVGPNSFGGKLTKREQPARNLQWRKPTGSPFPSSAPSSQQSTTSPTTTPAPTTEPSPLPTGAATLSSQPTLLVTSQQPSLSPTPEPSPLPTGAATLSSQPTLLVTSQQPSAGQQAGTNKFGRRLKDRERVQRELQWRTPTGSPLPSSAPSSPLASLTPTTEASPTTEPSPFPTGAATVSMQPTHSVTSQQPSVPSPTTEPSSAPIAVPSAAPTVAGWRTPTTSPVPSPAPTAYPTTLTPTTEPSSTAEPSPLPTGAPSVSVQPTHAVTSQQPTVSPPTAAPSPSPTAAGWRSPTTSPVPSPASTTYPTTLTPTTEPSMEPSISAVSPLPTGGATGAQWRTPTTSPQPSPAPSPYPTEPSIEPSTEPSVSAFPTGAAVTTQPTGLASQTQQLFVQDIISLSIRTVQTVPSNSTNSTGSSYARNHVDNIIQTAKQDGSFSTSLITYLVASGSDELTNPTTIASVLALGATTDQPTTKPTGCTGTGPRIGSGCGGDVGNGGRMMPRQTAGGARGRAGCQRLHILVLVVVVVVSIFVQH